MKWIVIAKSCDSCGGDIAFEIFNKNPTEEDIRRIIESLGGMSCINNFVKKIEDGINEIKNDTYQT